MGDVVSFNREPRRQVIIADVEGGWNVFLHPMRDGEKPAWFAEPGDALRRHVYLLRHLESSPTPRGKGFVIDANNYLDGPEDAA